MLPLLSVRGVGFGGEIDKCWSVDGISSHRHSKDKESRYECLTRQNTNYDFLIVTHILVSFLAQQKPKTLSSNYLVKIVQGKSL